MDIQWTGWASLGRPTETEIGRPFAHRNLDGRLEVFALGRGDIQYRGRSRRRCVAHLADTLKTISEAGRLDQRASTARGRSTVAARASFCLRYSQSRLKR